MKDWFERSFYVSVGVGMALATAVFTMIGSMFASAPLTWVLLGILMGGLFCMVIALSIGELASMYPSAPGIRTYLKNALGDRPSLLLVYLYLIFVVLIAGLEGYMFARVFEAVFPRAAPMPTVLVLVLAVVAINLWGLNLPRGMQMLTALLCLGVISVSGVIGLAGMKVPAAELFAIGNWSQHALKLPALVGMAIFLFMGFEWVTPLGLRPQAYQKKIPWSMPIAVLALMVTYSMFALGAASQLPLVVIAASPTPQVPYFIELYGSAGAMAALALSLGAIFSTYNAGIMGGSRLIFVLSREGHLPAWCAHRSIRTGAPVGAILLLGSLALLSSVAVISFKLEILTAVIGATIVAVVYAAFMLSTMLLRHRKPEHRRPFRSPVPQAVQWLLILLLPLVGVMALVSDPELSTQASLGALACLAVAAALSWTCVAPRASAPVGGDS